MPGVSRELAASGLKGFENLIRFNTIFRINNNNSVIIYTTSALQGNDHYRHVCNGCRACCDVIWKSAIIFFKNKAEYIFEKQVIISKCYVYICSKITKSC